MGVRTLALVAAFVVASIATPAAAQDLSEARRLLISRQLADRVHGIDLLVKIDSAGAIQALEDAIKRSSRELERLAKLLDKADDAWGNAFVKRLMLEYTYQKGSAEWKRWRIKELEYAKRWIAHSKDAKLHLRVMIRAGEAFAKLRSHAAIERIEAGAATEPNALVRQLYIAGLGHESRKRSVPTLLALLDHRAGRVRSQAVRSLLPFVDHPGVLDRIEALEQDPAWQVRLGSYHIMARAPFERAIPYLVRGASAESGEIALAIDALLKDLTGRSFAGQPAAWGTWWAKHRKSILDGSYTSSSDKPLPRISGSVPTFFRIPIESTRVVFAIDFSASMTEDMTLKDAKTNEILSYYKLSRTRLGYAKAELIRALKALPDGALFNVVIYHNTAKGLNSRLMKMTPAARRRTIKWVAKSKTGEMTNIWDALRVCYNDYLGSGGNDAKFLSLPDTIVFLTDGVPTRGRFRDTESLREIVRVWNLSVGMTIHCVAIGDKPDRKLLEGLARDTGGYYMDLKKGLRSFKERQRVSVAPGEVSTPVGDKIEAAINALGSEDMDKRLAAVRELAGHGRHGVRSVPKLVAALTDDSEEVCNAIYALLRIYGKPAIGALAGFLSDNEDDTAEAAAIALGKFGADAAPAVPKLIELLESDRMVGPTEAARALGEIGPPAREAVPALEEMASGRGLLSRVAQESLRKIKTDE
ncbi:MAG: HEAT repeat domain-containing protein [Planctomycetota bacterium]|nr:HEAT repeat domain-containing protein [Planctomycetota bacterium]